jgi:membrane-bound serine protease (ClpP class)
VEAERIVGDAGEERPLLSSGTVESIPTLLETVGLSGSTVVKLSISGPEKVARYIEMLSVFFLAGGLLGLYIEFKTPGFGLPGLCGIALLAIWFWGHHVAGLAGAGELLIFVLGIALLAIEVFLIPGFGVVGLTGLVLIAVSLVMAMVEHYPGGPWLPPPLHLEHAIKVSGLTLILVFVAGWILARFLPETPAFRRVMLTAEVSTEKGYSSSQETSSLVGLQGTAETVLHPAGIGVFGDKRLNVVARGSFIDKGAPIVVAETHGNRIVADTVSEGVVAPKQGAQGPSPS